MADSQEKTFQKDILAALAGQQWLIGKSADYDRANALYPEDLVEFHPR